MKNPWICLLASALLLAGCQATQSEKKSPASMNKKEIQQTATADKTKAIRQNAHGLGAEDRAEFIVEYGGDQKLSKADFDAARAKRFNGMDANHNGGVDEQEYVDEYAARLEKQISEERTAQVKQTVIRFSAVDKNNDKKITPDEFQASGKVLFDFLDKKHRGVIDANTPEPENDGNIDRSILAMPSTHSVKGFLEIYDTHGNNQVTRADFDAQRKQKFDATDTNHDGWLNSEEYLLEFENRLDYQAKQVRSSRIKQAHVRFNVLDADKNGVMTLQEFNTSGDRIFKGWDVNQDGWVNSSDPLPEPKEREKKPEIKDENDKSASKKY